MQSSPPTAPAIEARGLVKTYPGPGKTRVSALDGLTLGVTKGTIFALVGPNGAGKTTTVKILTTLASPDAGTATVEGIDVIAAPAQARRVIGVVAQRSGADPAATGRENLILQAHLYGMPTSAARARADELLDRFQLTAAGGRFVRTYSGGMQRRLDVALGLMHRPKVLFLDEPTAGIDPVARRELWDFLFLLAGRGVTLFVTTHYMDEAERCGALGYIYMSKLLVEGDPSELKLDPRVTPQGYRWLEATTDHPAALIPALNSIDGVDNVTIFGNTLHLRAADQASDGVIHDKIGQGVEFLPGAPTLEDVFVMLTKQAEAEHGIQAERPYEEG